MKFCSECDTKFVGSAKFCGECGKPRTEVAQIDSGGTTSHGLDRPPFVKPNETQNNQFAKEREALKDWQAGFKPILWLSNSDPDFVDVWSRLEGLNVPVDHLWVNYDDGDGRCYLVPFKNAPSADDFDYVGMFVCEEPCLSQEFDSLLTDIDESCEDCDGGIVEDSNEKCVKCSGTGIIWFELQDVSGVSRNIQVLDAFPTVNNSKELQKSQLVEPTTQTLAPFPIVLEKSAFSTPARQDLVNAYLESSELEEQERILVELIEAGDVHGLLELSRNELGFDAQVEADEFARQAISCAPIERLAEAAFFYVTVILLPNSRYEEAMWVSRAVDEYEQIRLSESLKTEIRTLRDAQGLIQPNLGGLLEEIDPRQPTSASETQERYRDVLIARFVYDFSAGDELTVGAFESKTQGRFLPATLEFIDHWGHQYEWLSREVISSALFNAAILIGLKQKSPWIKGGYLNP